MTAKVVYTGDLRTEAVHLRSGTIIQTDAPLDNQGKGERFSPTDLVAAALATCMLTTMGIVSKAHDINIDGATCEVEKIMIRDPRRIGEIKISFHFPNPKKYTDDDKELLQETAMTCPVIESLHPDCRKTVSFNW